MKRTGGILLALGVLASSLPAAAAGFREQKAWQFRSPSATQVLLNLEVRRLELRNRTRNGGSTGVVLGGAALAPGDPSGTTSQTGASALNSIDAAPGLTVAGDNNVVTVDGFLNLTVDQQADRARSRILNR